MTLTAFSDGLSTVAERTMTIEAIPAGSGQPATTPTEVGGAGAPTPQATPSGGSESSGGCSLGGSTADIGLIAAVMMVGLVGTARAGRRRRGK